MFYHKCNNIKCNSISKNKCVPKVYVFGLAASFNDSIVYLTNIQELDSAWIDDKNDFWLTEVIILIN